MREIYIKLPRELEYLKIACNLASQVAQTIDKNEHFSNEIELAVSEAFTNAIKHADYTKEDDTLTLSFKIFNNKLVISLRDKGKGFKLDSIPEPNFDKIPESGYGLYIIKKIMNKLSYVIDEDGYNVLVMEKSIPNQN